MDKKEIESSEVLNLFVRAKSKHKDYKKIIKKESTKDQVQRLLKYGPLSISQIAERLKIRPSQVSSVCRNNPDTFEIIGKQKINFGNSYIWRLKENDNIPESNILS